MHLTLEDADLFYTAIGAGPPCLVMHGGPGIDHTYLRPDLDPLADVLRLVYYDHRGNGRSSRPPAKTLAPLAADADALRAHLGFARTAVFGHSFGGVVALEYAIALYFMHHNLARPRKTLKGETPAMAAGLTDHVWSVAEIVAMVEALDKPPRSAGRTSRASRSRAIDLVPKLGGP